MFWYNLWQQCGEPKTGIIYDNMRAAKKDYMYACRRYRRKEKGCRIAKMCEQIANDNSRDFFKEIKKLNPKPPVAPMINGLRGNTDIANHFANKYKELYNSVPSEREIMSQVYNHIEDEITNCDVESTVITVDIIKKALAKMKLNKSDGDKGYMSNHLIWAGDTYHLHIALLL